MMENTKTLEEQIYEKLKEQQLLITTAESCTGGLLSGRLINVAGISTYLKEAYVTYCDESKHKLLGVSTETLEKYTAVSEQTACEMAIGGAKAARADICLSVTGIAGPDGEGDAFPAGLVYIGCYYKGTTSCLRKMFSGNRMEVRNQAVEASLVLLLEIMKQEEAK